MEVSPRLIAFATLGVGVITFGALLIETRGSGLQALDLNNWRDTAQAFASPNAAPTMAFGAMATPSATPIPAPERPLVEVQGVPDDAPAAPALAMPGPARPERLDPQEATMGTPENPTLSPFGLPCGLTVSVDTLPGAIIALDVMDPCQPNARVVVEHSGLNLTGQTDVVGLMTMDIPVFEAPAFFTVRMPDGNSASALAIVPDLENYFRTGIQWTEDRQLELHAMEFGATYGEAGHIWQDNPGSPDRITSGEGGFLMQVGDATAEAPMLAQIYSFPRDVMDNSGIVSLSIETPVTASNCGQDTLARTLETEEDGRVAVIELTFTLPPCDTVGDYLVLQNLLQDLRLASN